MKMFCFFSHLVKISVHLHVFLILTDLNNMIVICPPLSLCSSFALVNIPLLFISSIKQTNKQTTKTKTTTKTNRKKLLE